MSHHRLAIAVDVLLTDEQLRTRFALDPFGTVADLTSLGVELTSDEIDSLIRADARIWFWNQNLFRGPAH